MDDADRLSVASSTDPDVLLGGGAYGGGARDADAQYDTLESQSLVMLGLGGALTGPGAAARDLLSSARPRCH